jgi:hypothetical protein
VVVLTACVPRNAANARYAAIRSTIGVAISHAQNAARARHQRCRIKPLLYFFSQVAHAALLAGGNPCAVRLRMSGWSRVGDTCKRKSMFATAFQYCARAFQRD